MKYIKKSELRDLVSQKLNDSLKEFGFSWKKSNHRFFRILHGGIIIIDYRILDSYNFKRNEVAWEVEIYYFIRYDTVHEWFEVFERGKKNDYKQNWTYGENLNETNNISLIIDVDESDVDAFLNFVLYNVKNGLDKFFVANKTLLKLYNNKIPKKINTIEDLNEFENFNFRTAIECLSISKILNLNNFQIMSNIFKTKLENYFKSGDPMTMTYYPIFDEIIDKLESTDFSKSVINLNLN